MNGDCEGIRAVIAGVIEGAIRSPHLDGCSACAAAAEEERVTRDAVRRSAPSWRPVAVPTRRAGQLPIWGLAAAGMLLGLSLASAHDSGADAQAMASPRISLPDRSAPELAEMMSGGRAPLSLDDLMAGPVRRTGFTTEGGR